MPLPRIATNVFEAARITRVITPSCRSPIQNKVAWKKRGPRIPYPLISSDDVHQTHVSNGLEISLLLVTG